MTSWFERDDWCQDKGTLTGFSGCDMSAHYYSPDGDEMCWIQAITWQPVIDKNHIFKGYAGSLVFVENIYEESINPPKLFWIKVIANNEQHEQAVMTIHHIELLEPFVGYDKAYPFTAESKTKFKLLGE